MLAALLPDRMTQSPQAALASLSLAVLLASFATSAANVALPALTESFARPFEHVQWVVLAYLLAITTLVIAAGRLGDLFGAKRMLLVGVGLFGAASAFCAMAPNLELLIAARAIQGAGAAFMMTLAMALAARVVPNQSPAGAIGLLGAMSAIGTALGPALGGVLIHAAGWRAIFFVLAAAGFATLALTLRSAPADQAHASRTGAFDLAGAVLLAVTLAAYALAMTTSGGQMGLQNAALGLVALLGLALFVVSQARSHAPLVRPALFADARLRAGLVASMLVATVMMGTLVVGPFYLSAALGLDARSMGMVMSVGPLVAALAGAPSGRIVNRLHEKRATMLALVGMAVGAIGLALAPRALGVAGYAAPLAVLTAAYALFQTANNSALIAGAAVEERGVISAMVNLSRNLGLITGASVLGAIFSAASGLNAGMIDADAASAGLRVTFGAGAALILIATFVFALNAQGSRP